jgi:hypothetical protein
MDMRNFFKKILLMATPIPLSLMIREFFILFYSILKKGTIVDHMRNFFFKKKIKSIAATVAAN